MSTPSARNTPRLRQRMPATNWKKVRLPLSRARENPEKLDWSAYTPKTPSFFGTKIFEDYDLAELAQYIDWTPFFQTWELKGRYPAILEDEKQGEAARALFADAQAMLKKIIDEKWFRPRAVIGFWPAGAVGDDIKLCRRDADCGACDFLHASPAALEARWTAECGAVGFRGPRRQRR